LAGSSADGGLTVVGRSFATWMVAPQALIVITATMERG